MVSSLSSLATCKVVADDYQDLQDTGVNTAVARARAYGESERPSDIQWTSASGLLTASRAFRVAHDGKSFNVLGARN